MISFLSFKKKYKRYKKSIDATVQRVFDRGWFILGPELKDFETNFAEYLGVKFVVGVNSGTDAIFLALRGLGVRPGDEVITVANTATPTVSAIRMTGATPVFVDVEHKSHNLDASLLEKAITSRTKAIVPVHLYGLPANLDEILEFTRKREIAIVEDVAQAQGATYRQRSIGSWGNAGCFSFYPTKNLGAFGDGGAVATDDQGLAEQIRALRNYGEQGKFNNVMEGVNSRLDEIQAALLSWGLRHVEQWNRRREEIAHSYTRALESLPLELPQGSDALHKRVWHLFVIKTAERDRLRKYLSECGIETMVHYPTPIHLQPAYRFLGYGSADLPVTTELAGSILSLPIYPELTDSEVGKVCAAIKEFYA
jgi:dTDP-4-amino-4,6-dideoxygalactose transaminase